MPAKHWRSGRRGRPPFGESLADRVGVHRTYMGHVERGESNIAFYPPPWAGEGYAQRSAQRYAQRSALLAPPREYC